MVEMDSSSQMSANKQPNTQLPNQKAYESAVAHEFVRQYYTIMHKSPELLFRFYSQDSSLVHGDLEVDPNEQPKNGLDAIEKHFSSLVPSETSAKIRHLDAMSSVGNSIVVQVSGTLVTKDSRRPFVQTFILVAQATNKYYVRNDIFRYQEVPVGYLIGPISPQPEAVVEPSAPSASEEEEMAVPEPEPEPQPVYEPEPEPEADSHEEVGDVPLEEPMEPEAAREPETKIVENGHDVEEEKPATETEKAVDNGPKSYASMLTKTWSHIAMQNPNTVAVPEPVQPKAVEPVQTFADHPGGDSLKSPLTSPDIGSEQAPPKFPKKTHNNNGPNNGPSPGNGFDRKFESKLDFDNGGIDDAPGDCQLFVGNLLATTQKEDLIGVFGKYGKITNVRLNRTNRDRPGVKNYGFISFESPEIVDQIVAKKPIFHEGHRFNVERKDPGVRAPRKFENRPFGNSQRGGNPPIQATGGPRNGNLTNNGGGNNYRGQGQQAGGGGNPGGPGNMQRTRNMHYQSGTGNPANPPMNRNFAGGKNRV